MFVREKQVRGMKPTSFLAAYLLVLFSEFLDSEALYTMSALAVGYSPLPILAGNSLAFAL